MSLLAAGFILLAINVLLLIIFNIRFKSMFSTDRILAETRDAINKMLRDLNGDADRNLQLMEAKIRQVKAVTAEAERRIEILRNDLENTQRSMEFQRKVEDVSTSRKRGGKTSSQVRGNSTISGRYSKNDIQGDLFVTEKGMNELGMKPDSGDSDSFRQIPVISGEMLPDEKAVPEIIVPENPVVPQKSFNEIVSEFHARGMTAEQIAQETKRSVQEVRLVLQLVSIS